MRKVVVATIFTSTYPHYQTVPVSQSVNAIVLYVVIKSTIGMQYLQRSIYTVPVALNTQCRPVLLGNIFNKVVLYHIFISQVILNFHQLTSCPAFAIVP